MSDIASITALSATLVSAIAAAYSFYTTKMRHKQVKSLYESLENTYQKLLADEIKRKIELSDISDFKSEIFPVINQATKALHEITGKEISTAIKLLRESEGGEYDELVTFLRDSSSANKREVLDYIYPISTNTAYKDIFNSYKSYVLDNDISTPSEGGYVNNKRDVIESLYKSTLLLPLIVGNRENHKHILGVLAFDSKDKNAFDSKTLDYAEKVSELISVYLSKTLYEDELNKKGITSGSTGR
ncbi:MAG: hypothetical protein KZQ93_13740 [Candidatus Thiodiazotropha sp. (ex Monitilora ramsayi)]|nr:hypothetical protein [Candidatus Thiodiazotropha sp. (ex Monitilora ramsayi)]